MEITIDYLGHDITLFIHDWHTEKDIHREEFWPWPDEFDIETGNHTIDSASKESSKFKNMFLEHFGDKISEAMEDELEGEPVNRNPLWKHMPFEFSRWF